MAEPSPHGRLAKWVRLTAASLVFGPWALAVFLACVPLLPWRAARLRVTSAIVRPLGPILLAILGIRLQREHIHRMREAEPAIFVFNHASALDALASMAIWPTHGCGIGKKEQARIPVWGMAYAIAGNLFIDRSDTERAIATMNEAVETIHRIGISPWIAPEGTRSLDGRLGPFKKGFAHMAIASRLPVVPVVFHGAHALWPTRTRTITPGTLRIEVLEPMSTNGWTPETIEVHVADVRSRIAAALEAGINQGAGRSAS